MKKSKFHKDKQMSSKVAHFAEGGRVARSYDSFTDYWNNESVAGRLINKAGDLLGLKRGKSQSSSGSSGGTQKMGEYNETLEPLGKSKD